MKLSKVILPKELYSTVLAHAFTTEEEEIIGLLLGDWRQITEGDYEAIVTHISVVVRVDKRKDRVEVAPEQLHEAFLRAEEIEKETKRSTKVVGWYHSHPHITVFPSSIDLRTQAGQQSLDSRFFGLIVSCFDISNNLVNTVKITCFQTTIDSDNRNHHSKIPLKVVDEIEDIKRTEYKDSMLQIIKQLFKESREILRHNLETLSKVTMPRNLGLVDACTNYNLSLWAVLSAYLYPSLDALAYSIISFGPSRGFSQYLFSECQPLESSSIHPKDSPSLINRTENLIDI